MLPQFTLKNLSDRAKVSKADADGIDALGYPMLDYEEAANYGQSKFAKMIRYYQYLERILQLEWFIVKL